MGDWISLHLYSVAFMTTLEVFFLAQNGILHDSKKKQCMDS